MKLIHCADMHLDSALATSLTRQEARRRNDELFETFIKMIRREETNEQELEKLEDAIAFKNISHMPARVKCALLAWHTLEDLLEKCKK